MELVVENGWNDNGLMLDRLASFPVAIGRGGDKEKLAKDLGAHVYIDTAVDDAVAVLQRMGGARAILATAPSGSTMGPLVSGLAACGKLIVAGVPNDEIRLNAFPLVFGGRSIYRALTGTAIDSEDTLAFSVQEKIRPMIETAPLEQAADAVLIILDRAVAYWRSLRLPRALAELVETYGFAWDDGRSGYAITSSKPSRNPRAKSSHAVLSLNSAQRAHCRAMQLPTAYRAIQ